IEVGVLDAVGHAEPEGESHDLARELGERRLQAGGAAGADARVVVGDLALPICLVERAEHLDHVRVPGAVLVSRSIAADDEIPFHGESLLARATSRSEPLPPTTTRGS